MPPDYPECYWVLVADNNRLWLRPEHVDDDVMSEWVSFQAKKRKVSAAADSLHTARRASLSTATRTVRWGATVQHRKALIHDERAHEDAYPAGVSLNNHHVVKSCKNMTGIIIQKTTEAEAKSEIERAIDRELDALPEAERPEVLGPQGLANDFGQTHKNTAARHKSAPDSYNRLYLTKPPQESNKGKKRSSRGEEQPRRSNRNRYTDEVEKCVGFLGIALGRRELLPFRTSLLNHAEDYVQKQYALRAGVDPQASDPSTGVSQAPERCRDALLVLYRIVFQSADGRSAYKARS